MICKYLEKKLEIIPDENLYEVERPIELEYYLLESESEEYRDLGSEKIYGIEIIKKVNDEKVENELIKDLSCCKENTEKILSLLAENVVTPVALPFVLDDILGA